MGGCLSCEPVYDCLLKGFLNPRGDGSKEYYEVLGLDKSASLADIKKSYKKASLAYHPDKLRQRGVELSADDTAKFQKVKEAYECLSDPEKRKFYDKLGVNGMLLRENPSALFTDQNKLKELVENADRRIYVVIWSIMFFIFGFLLLFPLLFGLKADETISITFTAVWTPLWIIYGILMMHMIASVAEGHHTRPDDLEPEEDWEDTDPLSSRVLVLFVFSLFATFQILLCLRLDRVIGGPYADALIPYFLYDFIQICMSAYFYQTTKPKVDEDDTDEMIWEKEESIRQAKITTKQEVVYYVFRIIQVMLIALKSDGAISGSWWLVLLPVFVYIGLSVINGCRYRSEANSIELPEDEAASMEELLENQHKQVKASFSAGQVQAHFCTAFCFLLYVLLLGFYLAEDSDDRFSVFWFYFPFAPILFCGLCCLICSCFIGDIDDDDDDDEEVDLENPQSNDETSDEQQPLQPVLVPDATSQQQATHTEDVQVIVSPSEPVPDTVVTPQAEEEDEDLNMID